jgi:hypothetical protein
MPTLLHLLERALVNQFEITLEFHCPLTVYLVKSGRRYWQPHGTFEFLDNLAYSLVFRISIFYPVSLGFFKGCLLMFIESFHKLIVYSVQFLVPHFSPFVISVYFSSGRRIFGNLFFDPCIYGVFLLTVCSDPGIRICQQYNSKYYDKYRTIIYSHQLFVLTLIFVGGIFLLKP